MLLRLLRKAFRPAPSRQTSKDREHALKLAIQQAIKLAENGQIDASIAAYEAILKGEPESLLALHGLSLLLISKDRFIQAYAIARELTDQIPHVPEAWTLRALSARGLGLLDDALTAAEESVRIRPDPAMISCTGVIQFHLGRMQDALSTFDRAIALTPNDDSIHSNRLFVLAIWPAIPRETVVAEHFKWGRDVEARVKLPGLPHPNNRTPDRRLRIGYVSADLRAHPVATLLEPILLNHDRTKVEVFCYDCHGGLGDAVTNRLRRQVDQWIMCSKLSDTEMVGRIRADEIDILVDLSGHTAGNRLPVFAMKPAPVQVSWFGYMNTTGLTRIDYRLTDASLCPPGSEEMYSERLYRLPVAAAWAPQPNCPQPGPLPLLTNKHVTFGSFNNWSKVSESVISCWARILIACPESRLRVIAAGGNTPEVKQGIEYQFSRAGVPSERLDVQGTVPLTEFVQLVASVDIALDPFPYNGGTTSFHCIWMGVPFVSLKTDEELGRVGYGILCSVGLGDLCADSEDAYVELALKLAQDPNRLTQIRRTLREQLAHTGVMDAASITREVERAFASMWHNFTEHELSLSVGENSSEKPRDRAAPQENHIG